MTAGVPPSGRKDCDCDLQQHKYLQILYRLKIYHCNYSTKTIIILLRALNVFDSIFTGFVCNLLHFADASHTTPNDSL